MQNRAWALWYKGWLFGWLWAHRVFRAATLLMGRHSHNTNRLQRGFQNNTCQNQCNCGRMSFQKWLPPLSTSLVWDPVSFCFSGRLSIGRYDPGSFHITASTLGSGVCESLCATLRGDSLFPTPSGAPKSKPHWPSKSNILGVHLPDAGHLSWRTWSERQLPYSLGRTSVIVIVLLFVSSLPGGCRS